MSNSRSFKKGLDCYAVFGRRGFVANASSLKGAQEVARTDTRMPLKWPGTNRRDFNGVDVDVFWSDGDYSIVKGAPVGYQHAAPERYIQVSSGRWERQG